MKLIAGSSHLPLAQSISEHLHIPLTQVEITKFANGEKRIWIQESVKGENVVIVQSLANPTDEYILETLLLVDAVERMGARHVNLAVPWLGYSLQDKAFREGEPIGAKVVANLLSNAYVKRVFLLDLHNSSTPGFFSIPTQHLSALSLFVQHARRRNLSNAVVASPDFGGIKRARIFAQELGLELVNIDKHRDLYTGEITAMGLSGEVKNKTVLLFDDVINSGGTVATSAQTLKDHGAAEVHFFATHGPLVETGFTKIEDSVVDSVVVTNSINYPKPGSKIEVVDVAPLFAQELKTWIKPSLTT